MSDFLRFPEPDGRTKVINPETGETWFEGEPDDAPKADPRVVPFASPNKAVETVESPFLTNEDVAKARPEPDTTEQLATETVRAAEPLAYPVGAPELRSLLRLPFKRRANAMRLYQLALDAWNKMPANGTNLDSPDKLERYFGALQAFDEFLESVAANSVAYRSWVDTVDDGTFGELFFAYITRFGLGES